jgi:hypothetical protein
MFVSVVALNGLAGGLKAWTSSTDFVSVFIIFVLAKLFLFTESFSHAGIVAEGVGQLRSYPTYIFCGMDKMGY